MGEADIINATQKPGTIKSLYEDLTNLGVRTGDILLVHSSLSRIGWVCGGAHAVVSALIWSVGADVNGTSGGTLVMPAHSGDLSDPAEWANPPVPEEWLPVIYENMPAYIPEITPTRGIGCIPELFRTFPGVIRSSHPQVSFCAIGKDAFEITDGHPLSNQFGMESPLGRMYRLNAKVLMLGSEYHACTSFHLSEVLTGRMPVKRMGTAILENGERVWKWFDDFEYNNDDFDLIGKAFEDVCPVTRGRVGNAECRLFDMRAGVDFAVNWLKDNRFNGR